MEFTLNQALQKGIEAHKAGKAQEADRYYTAVLKANPKHPDANHNMGVLAVGVGKVEEALTFFKAALEFNPNIDQFWLSYIDALIKLDQIADAKTILDQARSNGAKGDEFDQLEKRIYLSESRSEDIFKGSSATLKEDLNAFYNSQRFEVLKSAAAGWLYSIKFDQEFLAVDGKEITNITGKGKNAGEALHFKTEGQYQDASGAFFLNNVVDKLNEVEETKERLYQLESLNCSENQILFADSFSGDKSLNFIGVQKNVFKKYQFNVVIIGAGPCGLYIANALKNKFKNKINILVLDNHCDELHFKKPFSRRWLTNLPIKYFNKYFNPAIRKLASSFGENGYIGLPMNLVELLLLISAKELGVKFLFEKKFDYSLLNISLISLVFDASGGRVPNTIQGVSAEQDKIIQIANRSVDYSFAGIKNLPINDINVNGNFMVALKENGYYHYPYLNEKPLSLPMMKLTQVPIQLKTTLLEFVKHHNNNRFYIWSGELVDEINELLILINLRISEYNYLKQTIDDIQKLSINLVESAIKHKKLEQDLLDFLKLSASNEYGQVYINSPFVFKPAINLKPLDQKINGIKAYPIGDSLFQGNPKVGNGLGNHLAYISQLVESIKTHQN